MPQKENNKTLIKHGFLTRTSSKKICCDSFYHSHPNEPFPSSSSWHFIKEQRLQNHFRRPPLTKFKFISSSIEFLHQSCMVISGRLNSLPNIGKRHRLPNKLRKRDNFLLSQSLGKDWFTFFSLVLFVCFVQGMVEGITVAAIYLRCRVMARGLVFSLNRHFFFQPL